MEQFTDTATETGVCVEQEARLSGTACLSALYSTSGETVLFGTGLYLGETGLYWK